MNVSTRPPRPATPSRTTTAPPAPTGPRSAAPHPTAPRPRPGGPRVAGPHDAGRPSPTAGPSDRPARPLVATGGIAAGAVAVGGLAVVVTLTLVGWVAAPHTAGGLTGVLRIAVDVWLAAHHVGFTLHGVGSVGMLPLGSVLLPGALLWRAGRWVVRSGQVRRLRHVGYAAVALAVPYAMLAGALAVAGRTTSVAPSLPQAVADPFLLALVAGGLGGARALAPWRSIVTLLAPRARSLLLGFVACLAVLVAAGALLVGGLLAAHLGQFRATTDALLPGNVGAGLLLLAQLCYAPNAVVWAIAYTVGPGFAFGVGTVVAPTGATLGALPAFPMLAALPGAGSTAPPTWLAVLALSVPYLAAVVGGVLAVRVLAAPVLAAPLWGLVTGSGVGAVVTLLAAASGGPLGHGRLAAVGPSPWRVGLLAVAELGVTSAAAAGVANWLAARQRGGARRMTKVGRMSRMADVVKKLKASNRTVAASGKNRPRSGPAGARPARLSLGVVRVVRGVPGRVVRRPLRRASCRPPGWASRRRAAAVRSAGTATDTRTGRPNATLGDVVAELMADFGTGAAPEIADEPPTEPFAAVIPGEPSVVKKSEDGRDGVRPAAGGTEPGHGQPAPER